MPDGVGGERATVMERGRGRWREGDGPSHDSCSNLGRRGVLPRPTSVRFRTCGDGISSWCYVHQRVCKGVARRTTVRRADRSAARKSHLEERRGPLLSPARAPQHHLLRLAHVGVRLIIKAPVAQAHVARVLIGRQHASGLRASSSAIHFACTTIYGADLEKEGAPTILVKVGRAWSDRQVTQATNIDYVKKSFSDRRVP